MLQTEINHLKKERGQLPDRSALDTSSSFSSGTAWQSALSAGRHLVPDRPRAASLGALTASRHAPNLSDSLVSVTSRREVCADLSTTRASDRPPRPSLAADRRRREGCSVPAGLNHEQLVARARQVARETSEAIERSKLSRSHSATLRTNADAPSPSTVSTTATSFSRPDLQWGASSRTMPGGLSLAGSPFGSRWSESSLAGATAAPSPQPLCPYPPSPEEDWPAPSSGSGRRGGSRPVGSASRQHSRSSPARAFGTSPLRRGRQAWEALEAAAPPMVSWQDQPHAATSSVDRSFREHEQAVAACQNRVDSWAWPRSAMRGASPRPLAIMEPPSARLNDWILSQSLSLRS